jgi:hypothetical protein
LMKKPPNWLSLCPLIILIHDIRFLSVGYINQLAGF